MNFIGKRKVVVKSSEQMLNDAWLKDYLIRQVRKEITQKEHK